MPPPPNFGVSGQGGGSGDASSERPGPKVTPRDFLAGRLPGPYTCLRARDRALLGFDFHLARLLHSIR